LYFDPRGLLVAESDGRVVGFVHAGFGFNADETGLEPADGVICAVLVHPAYRRRGIGRELVDRAENYLRAAGSTSLQAGPTKPRDPFYFGLYGGSALPGFLESDANAAPFFQALGYSPVERRLVFQRDLKDKKEPIDMRLMANRRALQLGLTDRPEKMTFAWASRYGRFEALRFLLLPKKGGVPVAEVTCFGLDLFAYGGGQRTVGLADLEVAPSERRKGYGKMLLLDVFRRLREEVVTHAEIHASETNAAAVGLLKSIGFSQVDAGMIYRK
jgi:ribosomal protein S18 acetylase RimI-like enzyme